MCVCKGRAHGKREERREHFFEILPFVKMKSERMKREREKEVYI